MWLATPGSGCGRLATAAGGEKGWKKSSDSWLLDARRLRLRPSRRRGATSTTPRVPPYGSCCLKPLRRTCNSLNAFGRPPPCLARWLMSGSSFVPALFSLFLLAPTVSATCTISQTRQPKRGPWFRRARQPVSGALAGAASPPNACMRAREQHPCSDLLPRATGSREPCTGGGNFSPGLAVRLPPSLRSPWCHDEPSGERR